MRESLPRPCNFEMGRRYQEVSATSKRESRLVCYEHTSTTNLAAAYKQRPSVRYFVLTRR
jgi:hypothetical protein